MCRRRICDVCKSEVSCVLAYNERFHVVEFYSPYVFFIIKTPADGESGGTLCHVGRSQSGAILLSMLMLLACNDCRHCFPKFARHAVDM